MTKAFNKASFLDKTITTFIKDLGCTHEQLVAALADHLSDTMPTMAKDCPDELVCALQALRRAQQKLNELNNK